MSRVAFVSAKGSPGVTTSVVGLGAAWPSETVILMECDGAGGDLGCRFGLNADPGVVSLAAASRRERSDVSEHCQSLPGGLRVVASPAAGERATAAVSLLSQCPPEVDVDETLLMDCGRFSSTPAVLVLLKAADLVVVVGRPTAVDVSHMAPLVSFLRGEVESLGLLVTGSGPYRAEEVSAVLEVGVIGTLPSDNAGAALLCGDRGSERLLARSPLIRACRVVAGGLSSMLKVESPAEVAS